MVNTYLKKSPVEAVEAFEGLTFDAYPFTTVDRLRRLARRSRDVVRVRFCFHSI